MFSLISCTKKKFCNTEWMPAPKQQIPLENFIELARLSREMADALAAFAEFAKSKNTDSFSVSGWKKILRSLDEAKQSLASITGQASGLEKIEFWKCLPSDDKMWTRGGTKEALSAMEGQVAAKRKNNKK